MINNRYKIINKLGEGRSRVYLCEDILRSGKKLALKILPVSADRDEKKSFRDEYFLLKKLDHPNIISVFEYSTIVSLNEEDIPLQIETGSPYFTLEYFEGGELYEYQELNQEKAVKSIICQISSVLYYLHQSSYIYYDLKSENILVQTKDNSPVIKFIDFGLTKSNKDDNETGARGTAEYIAPEILRKEKTDHRADIYSFGILLYRIIYNRFPFDNNDQLSIYKAHLDEQFDFPSSRFSESLTGIVRKLLSKEPDERYYTSIGVLNEIDSSVIRHFKNEWARIKTFCGRKDSLSVITGYIEKENGGEVLSIRGSEGAGKSSLLNELNYKYPDSILISADQNIEYNIWQILLREILYCKNIYADLSRDIIAEAERILNGNSLNLVEDLKAVMIKLLVGHRFILLIDNFNIFTRFDLEILLQLMPVFQIGKIKVVLTEDSSDDYRSGAINNLQVINLNPFTETQVGEYVQTSFSEFCPRDEIKKAITLYSDLLPGSIDLFLRDLIFLDLFNYTPDGPQLRIDGDPDKILKGSHEEIYGFRLNNLDQDSRNLATFLCLFNINPDIDTVIHLIGDTRQKVIELVVKLSESNIIHFNPVLGTIQFTSRGMKEHIYSAIKDLKKEHLKVAGLITKNLPGFNRNELARHWELAGKYQLTYETLKEELEKARSTSALAYERNLLEYLRVLPLEKNSLRDVKTALSNCLFQIGELNSSLVLTEELLAESRTPEEDISLKILKGKILISLQSIEEGKLLLESVLQNIDEQGKKNEILAEIAEADYEMAKYEDAENLSDELIENKFTLNGTKAKIFRLKALIELYKNNNPDGTILFLKKALDKFQDSKQLAKVASMENNLGNIYNIVGERNLAEEYWNKALDTNNSIGNLLQNAIILLNFGIYYLESCNYEKAVEYYLEAQSFFRTLGDKNNLGITYIDLGEVYLILCEYEKAIEILEAAAEIFGELDNNIERGEAIFLLGKLFFEIGDHESLAKIIESYNDFLEFHVDKLDFNYNYLKVLNKMLRHDSSDYIKEVYSLRDRSKTHSDNLVFCELQVKIAEYLIAAEKYSEALTELISGDFVNICSKNLYFNSYRNYLIGQITEVEKKQEYKPFITYYEEAFNQIGSLSITELTWKILFRLYKVYKERGNISRMTEFKKYTRQTLLYIADQIRSERLKNIYLEKPERKFVMQELGQN